MKRLSLGSSLDTFIDSLEYTQAALAAEPLTATLVAAVDELIEEGEALLVADRRSRRALTQKWALVAVCDLHLDLVEKKAFKLAEVQDPALRAKMSKSATSAFLRSSYLKQCTHTTTIILPLLRALADGHPVKPYATEIETTCTALMAALEGRDKARGERALAAQRFEDWKEGANRFRTTLHAQLVGLAMSNGFEKSWADGFFPSEGRSKSAAEPTEPSPEA
ncbi:MAG: hypothetical protein RBU37_21885 [Myxococcota bacterium]|jgi:hypothetical protein|nr:hypothetical protein [Myxococcota bacterium]